MSAAQFTHTLVSFSNFIGMSLPYNFTLNVVVWVDRCLWTVNNNGIPFEAF